MKTKIQFLHGAALSVVSESTNPAGQKNKGNYAYESASHRQSDRVVRHETRVKNTASVGLPGSGPPAAAELVRLRNDAGGVCQIRRNAGGQISGTECPEHQPGVFGPHPNVRGDCESGLKLFRVWFSDYSTMLIDATDKEQAAKLGQAWSRHWDQLDPRQATTATKP